MKTQDIALYTAGAAATLGIGYLVYFDYKRRNDPTFKKQLKRERRKAAKIAKATEEEDKQVKVKLIETVITAAAKETYPSTPEEMEKYFMAQVAEGEGLCAKGEEFYNDAVLPFYKAVKVYPAPMELVTIYQKTLPQPVFETVVNILAIEQQAAEAQRGGDIPVE
ncbi:protein import receptor MAS20 [Absidia repens]|uniref:Protein import receptor MAS20 n=1 Tax=Absidia repens TaxID=90262 RepID=A0A1X2IZC9_9FUNG|nr:protein import receptor MAS20 [Absidia repens]